MRRYKQRDITDCGSCCLAYLAARFRLHVSPARLRGLVGTDQKGSSALGLVEAAKQLGFSARGVRGGAEHLPTTPLPAIAHCLIEGRHLHYVVLVAWTRRGARVMDPAVGRVERWSRERFTAAWTGVLILMAPGERFEPGNHTQSPVRRLLGLLRPHRSMVLQAFVGAVFSTLLGLAMSIYVQKIVDNVIPNGNRSLLNLLGLAMLVVLGFRLVLGWCESLLSVRMAQRIDATLILAYYRHLMRLPQTFFVTMRIGEITSRVGDALKIRQFLNTSLLSLLLNPLILLFSLLAMFVYSWKLAAVSLLLLPANLLIYLAVNVLNREYQRRIMERAADFDAQLVESLQAQLAIRQFGLEEQCGFKTETRLVRLLRATWKAALGAIGSTTATTAVTQSYMIGLLWVGAGLVLETGLTAGELMSCYTLAGYLTGPLVTLIGLNSSIQETLIATDRLFELMDLECEKDDGLMDFLPRHVGKIEFNQVTFRHPGRAATLSDLTLTLWPGRVTAVVGGSGCGKSTLLALLQRLYLPSQGQIRIGDHDLAYFRLQSLRQHLAVVAQQTCLLSGTILHNLAPAHPQPDVERLMRLCRELGALEFIEKSPQGFLTYLQENGSNLSGGQRQRLALVRALYLDAPILLLDEPTSALDAEGERRVIERLQAEARRGRVVVVAAHGASLISAADDVVVLEAGRVVRIDSRTPPDDAAALDAAAVAAA